MEKYCASNCSNFSNYREAGDRRQILRKGGLKFSYIMEDEKFSITPCQTLNCVDRCNCDGELKEEIPEQQYKPN